jgi:hypothetical protein
LRSDACSSLGAEQKILRRRVFVSDGRRRCRRLPSHITVPREQHPIARASSAFFASGTREAPLRHACHPIKAERPITRAAQQILYLNP